MLAEASRVGGSGLGKGKMFNYKLSSEQSQTMKTYFPEINSVLKLFYNCFCTKSLITLALRNSMQIIMPGSYPILKYVVIILLHPVTE